MKENKIKFIKNTAVAAVCGTAVTLVFGVFAGMGLFAGSILGVFSAGIPFASNVF